MSLRDQAAKDFKKIVTNSNDFGWDTSITPPDGEPQPFYGLSTDIGQTIDPDTGMLVQGRKASVAVSLGDLNDAGFKIPTNIVNKSSKPWVVQFNAIECDGYAFKVEHTMPDRAIGSVVLLLTVYRRI